MSSSLFSIYQIYFDDKTKARLEPEFIPYFNDKKDGYFENTVIKDIYDKINATPEAFAQADKYIGISSWKQRSKTELTGADIISRMQKDIDSGKEKDIYLYPPVSIIQPNYTNIAEGYDFNGIIKAPDIWTQHKALGDKVYGVDVLLNNSKVLPFNILDNKWAFCHCNYWIAKKEIFNEYYQNVLKPAIDFLERQDVKRLMPEWYTHSHENKRYSSSAFVLEGLFGAFVAHKEYSYSYIVKKAIRRKFKKINIIGYAYGDNYIPVINGGVSDKPVIKRVVEPADINRNNAMGNIIKLTPDNISKPEKDLHIFFHICCINNYIEITNEMLNSIISSGLYEDCKKIHYSVLGKMDDELKERISGLEKMELIHLSNDIKEVEYPTIINLYKFSQNNDAYILYIHTKGVSLPKDELRQCWRKRLVEKVITEYKTCISFLNEGCDVSGSGWKQRTSNKVNYFQGEYEHFSGNFWWATSAYIKKLPDIYTIRDTYSKFKANDFERYRLQCEFWIGMEKRIKVGVNGELNKEYSKENFFIENKIQPPIIT